MPRPDLPRVTALALAVLALAGCGALGPSGLSAGPAAPVAAVGLDGLGAAPTVAVVPPGPPTRLEVELVGDSVHARWAPPDDGGSAVVEAYRVFPGTREPVELPATSTSYHMAGVTRSELLMVQVVAVSDDGQSAAAAVQVDRTRTGTSAPVAAVAAAPAPASAPAAPAVRPASAAVQPASTTPSAPAVLPPAPRTAPAGGTGAPTAPRRGVVPVIGPAVPIEPGTAPAPAPAGPDWTAVLARAEGSLVRVAAGTCSGTGTAPGGSGFFVAPDLVATAAHVVAGTAGLVVVRDDGTTVPAVVVGRDPGTDVALLRLAQPQPVVPLAFAADDPAVGTPVAVTALPAWPGADLPRGVHAGSVVAVDVTLAPGAREPLRMGLLSTSVRPLAGAAGGPVLTAEGLVAGVVSRPAEGAGPLDGMLAAGAAAAAPQVAEWSQGGTDLGTCPSRVRTSA